MPALGLDSEEPSPARNAMHYVITIWNELLTARRLLNQLHKKQWLHVKIGTMTI